MVYSPLYANQDYILKYLLISLKSALLWVFLSLYIWLKWLKSFVENLRKKIIEGYHIFNLKEKLIKVGY